MAVGDGELLGSLDGGDRSRQSDFRGETDGPVILTSWPLQAERPRLRKNFSCGV